MRRTVGGAKGLEASRGKAEEVRAATLKTKGMTACDGNAWTPSCASETPGASLQQEG
jgi:hypothetical protein